jgi:adenylate kinase family enzyme
VASNEFNPSRIHIVGGPGSGKTTLAARIGQVLAVPVHDLDTIAYEAGAGRKRDRAARRPDVERIAQGPGWVAEGIYLWWCEPLAERADQIIWLDVPWRVSVFRIVRRHIALSLAGTNPHSGTFKLARFAWSTRRYYRTETLEVPALLDENDDGAISRVATRAWLKRYRTKVTQCRSNHDLDGVLRKLKVSRRTT